MDTQLPTTSPQNISVKKNGLVTYTLVILCVCFAIAAFFFYWQYTTIPPRVSPNKLVVTNAITVPKDAIKISGCIPLMGEHWIETKNIPAGPFYVVYNNQLTGIEFMFSEDEVKGDRVAEKSPAEFGKYMASHKLNLQGLVENIERVYTIPNNIPPVKEWTISWTPPHAGFVVPHYDVHLYFVDKKFRETICPNATEETALPPSLAEELQKRGIALPGAPAATPTGTVKVTPRTTVTP